MANTVASLDEVKGAQAFLKYLGVTYSDKYLILAVVAWFRQESGSIGKVIGNNPFNIRPGLATKLSNGVRKSRNGNGYFLTFASIAQGFKAAAAVLSGVHGVGYEFAIKGLKTGGKQGALDFLVALALSKWDAAHYGVHGPEDANTTNNHLLLRYREFTGLTMPAAQPVKPKTAIKAPVKPKIPRVLQPPVLERNYISGFAIETFYRERHKTV